MSSSHQEYAHLKIRLEDIEKATNNFADENLIGRGGFGKVYKGTLSWSGKLTNIAARRLHYDYGQGDLEFWTEISVFATLRHENLVSFIGYCNEEGEKIIINEYEAHESLDKHLSGTTLTWLKRLEICVDVARALNYIHCDDGHDSSVIHRNIKSSKILLDDKWKPKLSGFEHSKTNTKARRHRLVLTEITGTLGYVDPTYEKTGFVTHKSDVFSFGVVLFEVLCGRPRAFIQDQKEQHSPQFAKKDYKQGKVDGAKLDEIADPHLYADTECPPSTGSRIEKLLLMNSLSTLPTQIPSYVNSITSLDDDLMRELDRFMLNFDLTATDRPPLSFDNERPPSFVNQMPTSFGFLPSPSSPHKPPSGSDLEHTNEPTPSSSDEHGFLLEPLFTMKRLEQYLHSPNEEFLAQYAKYHYDEENLDDIIHPPLREQMDLQSLKIFSETAYNCLKEQRAQRPNIDQILRNLEKALELQMRHDNPHETVTAEIELTSSNRWEGKNLEHLKIPLTDIVLATRNFTKRYLGSGTYGKVYKAELDLPIEEKNTGELSKKWRTVAIKCIQEDKHGEEGFVAEIELLSSCKHPNIVSLLGFCDEGPHMILVYEHVYNGSLDNYLGRTDNVINLTWMQRLKICIDIAFGLNYLHTKVEDEERIIHRDIKSGNILLGKNWVAKIADFGLSRFHRTNQQGKTLHTENIAGTQVYLDPEYMKTGRLKRAIDIYSFGVVLFELLSGKLANDAIYVMENENGIAHVARRLFKERRINELVDLKIMEEVDELTSTLNKGPNQDSLKTFIAIAHQCVAETQDERPTTEDIIEELKKAISFQENNKDSLQMSFEEIESATQNFSHENIIGGGGFGKVFKGEVIRGNERNTIVAKRLDRGQGQGELHFLTELEILFEYKHENIIGLEGYCNEKDEKIIVYEHACNRSLDRYLNDDKLTWIKRLKICIDVARGLAFLHGGALTKEMVIHRDIKSANILLNGDWKAKISDFGLSAITAINQEVISKLVGTIGYVDPQYEITGLFTEKSDIYSFGVLLFEILYGRLLVPNKEDYEKKSVSMILKQIHEVRNVGLIVFEKIKKTIAPESLSTFQAIVSQCLDFDRRKRPTAEEVLQQLNKALEFQEDYEIWQPKLPKDYKEIIQMSKSPEMYSTQKKKDLYNMFSKGILLKDDKVWFSLGSNGNRNEMISARKFSYRNRSPHKWRHVSESRFKKVAEMLDISNLMIKIKTRTQFLSPDVMYGVHLVFKFSDSRQYSNKPTYVNLKYRKGRETVHAYFATWRDNDWMMIELYRFLNHNEDTIFKFIVESFSPCYCGDGAIFVESIEFRAIESLKHEEIEQLQDAQPVLKSNLNVDQLSTSSDEILKKYKSPNEDEKLLWLSEVNGKKHLMLSAKKTLNDFSIVKILTLKPSVQSRFQEVIELLPQQVFRTNCTIRSHMLSQDTEYLCDLVFKLSEKCRGLHGPVKVRELLYQENKEAEIIYFISPSPWNLHDITRAPKQREDGWMEVNVWKFNSNREHKNDSIPVSLKFISYEGTMSGLIVCGLEFRPM